MFLALVFSARVRVQLAMQITQSARLVTVGQHKMFLNCTGNVSSQAVILEAGTGDTSEVWSAVQKQIQEFAHVVATIVLTSGRVTSWSHPLQLTKSSVISILSCRPLPFPRPM
jgi:hypothetical protein